VHWGQSLLSTVALLIYVCVVCEVVVIFIICVVGLLFLYMLFLLCLDPLMTRRPIAYTEQHNEQPEEVSMVSGFLFFSPLQEYDNQFTYLAGHRKYRLRRASAALNFEIVTTFTV